MAIPEYYLFDLNFIFILLFRNIVLSMNLTLIFSLFISGLGMYLLSLHLVNNKRGSFIAALIFMFNGFFYSFILTGHINIIQSYSLMPFAFLFAYKALWEKQWITNSLITGIFLALQVLAGGIIFFLYTAFLIGVFFLFNLIRKKPAKALVKIIFICIIIIAVCSSLSTIKLLPALEFTEISSRSAGVSYHEFLGQPIKTDLSSLLELFSPRYGRGIFSAGIGVFGLLLMLLGLKSYKKRTVLFSIIVIIIALLIASGSFLTEILFKFAPGFNKMRHVERALVLFIFSVSLISAYGFNNLEVSLKKRFKEKNTAKYLFIVAVAIVSTELIILEANIEPIKVKTAKDIDLLKYLEKDSERFRTYNLALRDIIGSSGYALESQIGISSIKGGGGIWVNDYIEYLMVAERYNLLKLAGILNGKYFISKNEINSSGLEFIAKFSNCNYPGGEICGPYLYKNQEYIKRSYIVKDSILVIGSKEPVKKTIYSLLLNPDFNPKKAVLISSEELDDLSAEELKTFSAILLTGPPISKISLKKLEKYSFSGGKIFPDILKGESTLSQNDINILLSNLTKEPESSEIIFYSPNKIIIDTKDKKGFLVLSERYAFFPGWTAKDNTGKETKIYQADNAISSIYLNGSTDSIILEYKPKAFKYGALITSTAVIIILMFFSLRFIRKKRNKI